MVLHNSRISRRNLLHAVGGAGLLSLASAAAGKADSKSHPPELSSIFKTDSYNKAYSFLATMMDRYAQGFTVRLIQSYSDQQGLQSTAFTYDNAVSIHAFLVRGLGEDVLRAEVLGNALLHAQQNDAVKDGRLRQRYFVNAPDAHGAYVQPAGNPSSSVGSSTGDMAWAGMALAQLYRRTRTRNYLTGAVSLGNWIFNNTYDTRGPTGYNGGEDASNTRILYKSTEHNIDTYAFFVMLASLTGNHDWSTRAQHALSFLSNMWNSAGRFFWTGTGTDGVTVNMSNISEDVQTWSYLALLSNKYAASLEWVKSNLWTVDTPQRINSKLSGALRIEGLTFASESLRARTPSAPYDQPPDPNAVWLEGTAHGAAALARRLNSNDENAAVNHDPLSRDLALALSLLENIRTAQSKLGAAQTIGGAAIPAGQGVVAATSVCNTGFGSSYYPNLHIGATGWYLIAGQMANPFQLGYPLAAAGFEPR